MGDWQVGDMALCVRDDTELPPKQLCAGRPYTVARVIAARNGTTLSLVGVPVRGHWSGFLASRFIKITPPEADAFDREVIEQMTGNPATEGV